MAMIWKRWSRADRQAAEPTDPPQFEDRQSDDLAQADRAPAPPAPPTTDTRPAFLESLWREGDAPRTGPSLPRFTASATDDISTTNADGSLTRRRLALRDTLGASQPVLGRERFAGRHDALGQLIASIEQQRVHVVIYGERGIGKTSLTHVFAETAREARYLVLYGSCGTEARFDTMFRSFAARIPRLYHRSVMPNSPEAEAGDHFDKMLDDHFGPRELADLFAEVTGTRVIIILDEYDRVLDVNFRRDVAELIKNLSDRAARVQLVLTGVAQNLDELIGYAPSIRRNIVGLPMRPLKTGEVRDLLALGEAVAEIKYSDAAVTMITAMAGGSPYLVRLIAHQAGLAALNEQRSVVTDNHARIAVERVLTDWNSSLPRRVQVSLGREEARTHWPLLIAGAPAARQTASSRSMMSSPNLAAASPRPLSSAI
jgi:Cdc6-like AAA superfamily ATPase